MNRYVYKCNSRNESHQNHFGDWDNFFAHDHQQEPRSWGSKDVVPQLGELNPGDLILAYQTDRNELVGVATVLKWEKKSDGRDYVFMCPIERLGVQVRPLKSDDRVANIHAFKTREIKTLYPISPDDFDYLVSVARSVEMVKVE